VRCIGLPSDLAQRGVDEQAGVGLVDLERLVGHLGAGYLCVLLGGGRVRRGQQRRELRGELRLGLLGEPTPGLELLGESVLVGLGLLGA